jgi:hypothetical protein
VSEAAANPLQAAATRRSEEARKRTRAAIRTLDQRGERASILAVSKIAGVSRQFIYDHADLRKEIEGLRSADRPGNVRVPTREQASLASLESRLRAALAENGRLRAENQELRAELGVLYGEARRHETRGTARDSRRA